MYDILIWFKKPCNEIEQILAQWAHSQNANNYCTEISTNVKLKRQNFDNSAFLSAKQVSATLRVMAQWCFCKQIKLCCRLQQIILNNFVIIPVVMNSALTFLVPRNTYLWTSIWAHSPVVDKIWSRELKKKVTWRLLLRFSDFWM